MNVEFNISDFKIKFPSPYFIEVAFTCNDEPFYRFPHNIREMIVIGSENEGVNVLRPDTDQTVLRILFSPYALRIINFISTLHGVVAIFLHPVFNNQYLIRIKFEPYISINRRIAKEIMYLFLNDIESFRYLTNECRLYNDKRFFVNNTEGSESFFQLFFHHRLTQYNKILQIYIRNIHDLYIPSMVNLTRYGRKHFHKFHDLLCSFEEYYEYISNIYISPYAFTIYYDNDLNNLIYLQPIISTIYPELDTNLIRFMLNNQFISQNNGLYIE